MTASVRRGCPLLLLCKLLLQFVASTAASSLPREAVSVRFQPEFLHDLVEGEQRPVALQVNMSEEMFAGQEEDANWRIAARSMQPGIASVEVGEQPLCNKSSFAFDNSSRYYTLDSTITVKGTFLGKTGIQVRLVRAVDWLEEEWEEPRLGHAPILADRAMHTLDVWVKRTEQATRYENIFVASLIVLISIANVLMGCELDLGVVLATVRRPVAPLIGMFTQFVVMPLLAYSIAQSVFVPYGQYSFALGLFVTGCAPGGGASNFWTILLDGNVNLSVTMTFLSTVVSLFMMPMWMSVLGGDFLIGFSPSSRLRVPYRRIASSLASLVVPLLIGVAIAKWRPNWAARARKVMRPFIIFVLVFVVGFGALTNWHWFRMITWRALAGGLLLPWCGFMFGCFCAIITRRSPGDVTAIAIETGIQNTGIAILLLKFSFPAPDSDISSLIPMVVACFTPGPLLLGAAIHTATKAIRKRRSNGVDVEKVLPGAAAAAGSPLVVLSLPRRDSPCTGLIPAAKETEMHTHT